MRIPSRNRERFAGQVGTTLVECLAYLSLLFVFLGISGGALHRLWLGSVSLQRTADDLSRALQAGEHWRADIRSATGPPTVAADTEGATVIIPQSGGPTSWIWKSNQVWRLRQDKPAVRILTRVRDSHFVRAEREGIEAWRWDLEFEPATRRARFQPLFSFQAVTKTPP